MTLRSTMLGLLGAALVCGLACFNDAVMKQTPLIGSNMPLAIYGGFLLVVVLINPVLVAIWRRMALSGRELAVVLVLVLAACAVPSAGLLKSFPAGLVAPFRQAKGNAAWTRHDVLAKAPERMLPAVTPENEHDVVQGFYTGREKESDIRARASLAQRAAVVPWGAWARPLLFWIPAILLIWGAALGLSLVVHRQWADHEQLPYPVAQFANSLLPEAGARLAEVFRNKVFWVAAAAVAVLHLNNYACVWWPDTTVATPLSLNLSALGQLFTLLVQGGGGGLLTPVIFLTVVAFAYFLATDVSLSLAVGPPLWFTTNGVLGLYGISMGGGFHNRPTLASMLLFGAFFGAFLMLCYTGRRYYADTFRRAVGVPGGGDVARESVWGARLFLLTLAAFVIYAAIAFGLDWQIGLLYAGVALITMLVLSRAMAETGIFFQQLAFVPAIVLLGVMGIKGLGVEALIIIMLMHTVLMSDVREALMPFLVNSYKLLDAQRVPVGRAAPLAGAALALGLAVGLPVTMYLLYSRGADRLPEASNTWFAQATFDAAGREMDTAQILGVQQQALTVSGWEHFANISPNSPALFCLVIGAALVIAFTLARLRFTWWPLHPVMFLFWTTPAGQKVYFSFFLGWVLKAAVTRFGGARAYKAVKPAVIGLIAGEMFAGLIILAIGATYYFTTGDVPKPFKLTP